MAIEIPNADSLQTIAEIAIALAGFTGIVGAIRIREGGIPGSEMALLFTLVVVSGLVVLTAFLPSTLALVLEDEAVLWSWSFRCLLGAHVLGWVIAAPFMFRAGKVLEDLPQPQRSFGMFFAGLGLLAVGLEASVVAGFFAPYSPILFQLILLVLLLIAFGSFTLLLLGIGRAQEFE